MDKKQNKWKKIVGIVLLIGVLVFSFWYGGDAPGLQGFTSDGEIIADDGRDVSNEEDINTAKDKSESDKTDKTTVTKKHPKTNADNKSGLFNQIVMKVKRISASKKSGKNNPQINKKAQRNANKSVDKSKKKIKSKQNKNDKNSDAYDMADSYNSNIDNTKDEKSSLSNTDNKNVNDNEKNDKVENNAQKSNDINSDKNIKTESEATANKKNADIKEDEQADDTNDSDTLITCTVYISCSSVLDHLDKLTDATKKVIPEDGVILNLTTVKIKDGSTVFDVLKKAARENSVHLEYNFTPAYKTYYVEGIGNLYQFDAGNLSGWMYSVNDEFPGVGCSGYKVKDGDAIKWLYTCSFGKDVGGYVETKME